MWNVPHFHQSSTAQQFGKSKTELQNPKSAIQNGYVVRTTFKLVHYFRGNEQ